MHMEVSLGYRGKEVVAYIALCAYVQIHIHCVHRHVHVLTSTHAYVRVCLYIQAYTPVHNHTPSEVHASTRKPDLARGPPWMFYDRVHSRAYSRSSTHSQRRTNTHDQIADTLAYCVTVRELLRYTLQLGKSEMRKDAGGQMLSLSSLSTLSRARSAAGLQELQTTSDNQFLKTDNECAYRDVYVCPHHGI
jgi:hypothetical protein